METTFKKISRKTGKKETGCKCQSCKAQCHHPCLGTPEDMFKILGNGYADRVMLIHWAGAINLGVYDKDVPMYTPLYDKEKKSCTFFTDGLCELHEKGLKPTEGRLSHHSTSGENFNPKKSVGWAVAKEWLSVSNDEVKEMIAKYIKPKE